MYYQISKVIPPNTPKNSPLAVEIEIVEPFIYAIYIFFPPGPCGLAGFRILLGTWQFFPVIEDEWFIGDDLTLLLPVYYWLEHIPETFIIEFYNNDDTYEHLIHIGIVALSSETVSMMFAGGAYGIYHRPT